MAGGRRFAKHCSTLLLNQTVMLRLLVTIQIAWCVSGPRLPAEDNDSSNKANGGTNYQVGYRLGGATSARITQEHCRC